MATTNIGKPFGIVTSKNQATAITESKQTNNAGQFYITKTNDSNTGGVGNTEGNASDAIALTINGNVLRGISKADATKLANLSTNIEASVSNLMVGSGLIKTGNTISLNLGSGLYIQDDSLLGLELATADAQVINDNKGLNFYVPSKGKPMNGFNIYCGDGIKTKDIANGLGYKPAFILNIATNISYETTVSKYYKELRCSGLNINKNGQLSIALATISNHIDYIGNGLVIVGTSETDCAGLAISGNALVRWLNTSDSFSNTINSLVGPSINENLKLGDGLQKDSKDRISVLMNNKTIEVNASSELQVRYNNTLTASFNSGLSINLPSTGYVSELNDLPVSTCSILVNDPNGNGVCVDVPALKRLVELIMAAK